MSVITVQISLSSIAYEAILMGDTGLLEKTVQLASTPPIDVNPSISDRDLKVVLAENVAHFRAQQGITCAQLSLLSGLHRNELYRIEDASANANLMTLQKLAHGLLIPASELIK